MCSVDGDIIDPERPEHEEYLAAFKRSMIEKLRTSIDRDLARDPDGGKGYVFLLLHLSLLKKFTSINRKRKTVQVSFITLALCVQHIKNLRHNFMKFFSLSRMAQYVKILLCVGWKNIVIHNSIICGTKGISMEARMNFLAHAFVLLLVEMEMGNFNTSFSLKFLIKKLYKFVQYEKLVSNIFYF